MNIEEITAAIGELTDEERENLYTSLNVTTPSPQPTIDLSNYVTSEEYDAVTETLKAQAVEFKELRAMNESLRNDITALIKGVPATPAPQPDPTADYVNALFA